VRHETVVTSFKKCGINNVLDGTENDVLFGKGGSLYNKNSNNQCDSNDKDFRGFYDQEKLYTTLPFC
jgi:hypothetical protein